MTLLGNCYRGNIWLTTAENSVGLDQGFPVCVSWHVCWATVKHPHGMSLQQGLKSSGKEGKCSGTSCCLWQLCPWQIPPPTLIPLPHFLGSWVGTILRPNQIPHDINLEKKHLCAQSTRSVTVHNLEGWKEKKVGGKWQEGKITEHPRAHVYILRMSVALKIMPHVESMVQCFVSTGLMLQACRAFCIVGGSCLDKEERAMHLLLIASVL